MDYSLPGSSVHGMSQARILEQVAIPFSRRSSWIFLRIQPMSPALVGVFFTTEPPGKPLSYLSVQFSSDAQSCLTLCDPMDCRMPGFQTIKTRTVVHGITDEGNCFPLVNYAFNVWRLACGMKPASLHCVSV